MKVLNEVELQKVSGGILNQQTPRGGAKSQQNPLGGLSNLWEGANGYAYQDETGTWHYQVTKTPWQATLDTVVNGWANAAAGGFGFV